MRPRVYIAGPISKGDLCDNLNQATAAFVALAKAGCAPHCPHWSAYSKPAFRSISHVREVLCVATVSGNSEMTHNDWLGIDLLWVAVSDAVLRLPGESAGADREVAEAMRLGIPVFHSVADIATWCEQRQDAAGGRAATKPSIRLEEFSRINRERSESPDGFNHRLNDWSLSDWFTATMGELGEAANVAKKLNRIRDNIPGNQETYDALRSKLASELADTFIYLDLLAQSAGVDMVQAVRQTFNAKSDQIGCSIRL